MRILFYSHDSYGLGHVRRTIKIAERLLNDLAARSALVLTGSPRAHYFTYPPRCDYLKLPSVTKDPDGRYVSREIDLTLEETIGLRGRIIEEAARAFRPRIFLTDHSPTGLGGEVLSTLDGLGRAGALRVFGMRDIIDEPSAVRAAWRREGVVRVLRRCYERILVYGQQEIFDPVVEYGLPDDVARKIAYTGYIGGAAPQGAPDEIRRRLAPSTGRLVALTMGGGGDGNLLLRTFLEGYEKIASPAPFEVVAVTGPLMSPRKRNRYLSWARRLRGVQAFEYYEDLPGLYAAADLVVSMGGYNTICELAAAGAKALVLPRVHPRREQWLRAGRLAERGVVKVLDPRGVTPDRLMRAVLDRLRDPAPPRGWGMDLAGLGRVRREVASLAVPRLSTTAAPCRIVPVMP